MENSKMKQHILLVDDDDNRLKTITGRVYENTLSCKCTWAKNADHALKMLQYIHPDIMLYHAEESGQNGLVELAQLKGIRVVAYTDADTFLYENH